MSRFGSDPSVVEAWKSRTSALQRLNACERAAYALWYEASHRAGTENDAVYREWLTGLSQYLMNTHHGLVFIQERMAQGTYQPNELRTQPRTTITRPPTHVLRIAEGESTNLVERVNKLTYCICQVTHQPMVRPQKLDPLSRSRR